MGYSASSTSAESGQRVGHFLADAGALTAGVPNHYTCGAGVGKYYTCSAVDPGRAVHVCVHRIKAKAYRMTEHEDLGGAEPGREPLVEDSSPTAAPLSDGAAVGDDAVGAERVETLSPTALIPDHLRRYSSVDEALAAMPQGFASFGEAVDAFRERRRAHSVSLDAWLGGTE